MNNKEYTKARSRTSFQEEEGGRYRGHLPRDFRIGGYRFPFCRL